MEDPWSLKLDHEYAKSGRPGNTTCKLESYYLNFPFTYRMVVTLLARRVLGDAVFCVYSAIALSGAHNQGCEECAILIALTMYNEQ